jgi:two-component system LytT family response regulator
MARTNLLNKLISLGLESIQCEQADCGVSAVTMLRESSYDLVFMDINMPDLTAFEVLEQLADIDFLLVFVTAYDDYAISAFDYFAVGYILKPIDSRKLAEVVEKCTSLLASNEKSNKAELQKTLEYARSSRSRLAVPTISGFDLIIPSDITYLETEDGYTTLHLSNGEKVTSSKRLNYFQRQLDPRMYIRIHRSYIINLDSVRQYHRAGTVHLKCGKSLPVSRSYRSSFVRILTQDDTL